MGDSVLRTGDPKADRYNVDNPYTIGAKLLTEGRLYELTEQQRSDDPHHNQIVNKLYRGEEISAVDIKRVYKILSDTDLEQPEWVSAPILTSTNRERYTLTDTMARHFANFHCKPVIRWKRLHSKDGGPIEESDKKDAEKDPCYYEYFVAGTKGFFTETYIKELRLVNGIQVEYHSLSFSDEKRQEITRRLKDARPGELVTLLEGEIPLAINVIVHLPDCTDPQIIDVLQNTFSLEPGRIVIPVFAGSCKWTDNHITVYGGSNYNPFKMKVRNHFSVEPSFVITVHKSEGQTLNRIIIAMSHKEMAQCDFSYQQLHVALSRVRNGDHIRLLLTGDQEHKKWHSLTYLMFLRRDPSIQFFFDGFRPLTTKNPNANWMKNEWWTRRANDEFRERLGKKKKP